MLYTHDDASAKTNDSEVREKKIGHKVLEDHPVTVISISNYGKHPMAKIYTTKSPIVLYIREIVQEPTKK